MKDETLQKLFDACMDEESFGPRTLDTTPAFAPADVVIDADSFDYYTPDVDWNDVYSLTVSPSARWIN